MKWDFIKNLSHIVAVGNGSAELLQKAFNLKPAKVTVFAAEESQVKQLQRQFSGTANLTVKQAAVADANLNRELYQYNLAHLNALSPATAALQELFPSLKLLQKVEVDTQDIATELKILGLSSSKNMLMLSSPAQNFSLLQHLANSKQLGLFSAIVVQHSVEPCYKDAASLNELKAFLASQDYQHTQVDNTDPDFPILQFYRDANAVALKKAEQQNADLVNQLAEAKEQLAIANKQAEKQNADLVKQLAEAKEELAVANKQAEKQNADLVKQLAEAKEQLAVANKQAAQQNAALAKQFAEAKEQLSASNKQAEQQITELTKQLTSVKQQVELQKTELVKPLETTKKQLEKAHKELETFQKQAATRLEKINELEKINRLLNETNVQLSKRQQAIENEMLKAEAQLDIIKEFLLRADPV